MPQTASKLTPEQHAAIATRQVSVALSAGAGCGKTHVLTERFLSHLEPDPVAGAPLELHQLVAITFTDRAAREMRDRIRTKCYERLQQCSAQQVDHWIELLRILDTARVSTIHAFCGALLRSHAVEARLDPQFTVLEQAQADTLLLELLDDVLRERLNEHDPALLDLMVHFGLIGIREMVSSLVTGGRTIDFDAWLARTPAEVTAEWDRFRRETILPQSLRQISASPAASELLEVIDHLGAIGGELGDRCTSLKQLLPALAASKNHAADLEMVAQCARVQGVGKKLWPDETLYERFKDAATKLREELKAASALVEFDRAAAEADAKAGLDLLRIVNAVYQRYTARKQERSLLDFNDLLVRARDLLGDPAHAELQRRLSAQVRLVLVDECQDTDPVQVELVKSLCGERRLAGKLFFVGDYKQSIYRFRGADPGVFRRLQAETPPQGQLPLTLNFRSQPAILDFVNALFCDALSLGDAGSPTYEPLRAERSQVTPTPAVEFLWAVIDDVNQRDTGAKDVARRRDAEFVARRIRAMLDHGEKIVADRQPDGSWTPRTVKQGDIAILFRTLSDVQHYEEALRRYNIPYYLVGGHAFYAQQEIYDILNLLRALVSPADEVSLAGVLRSPIFAIEDETLFWLGQHRLGLAAIWSDEPLLDELTGTARERAQFAAATLRHLRDRKDRMPIVDLLNEALELTGYDAALLAEFMGERKLANLRKLLAQARTFDASGVLGLADFIVQLSEFVVRQPREPLAATHPEGTDVVRLMTIHQAKGLEFPVVFVPDVDRATRFDDRRAVWHDVLGPLIKLPAERSSEKCVSGLDLYREAVAAEEDAERLRVLYVATTRAADYLVLSGGIFNLEQPAGQWTRLLADRFDLETGAGRVSLPKGYAAASVKVTVEPPSIGTAVSAEHSHGVWQAALDRALRADPAVGVPNNELARPIAVDAAARRRFSISRLSGQLKRLDEFAPTVADEEGVSLAGTAADFGTLVHLVLARIDFARTGDLAAVVKRCADVNGYDGNGDAELCERLVAQFYQSARARDFAAARAVHRELEFVLAWPPTCDGATGVDQPPRYLQGYIDCLYQDADGRWHLLDYKTNNVAVADVAGAAAAYEMQLGVYALAVEEMLGEPPAELVVHFLRPSAEHRFAWNEDQRRRTIGLVNQAMDAMVHANADSLA